MKLYRTAAMGRLGQPQRDLYMTHMSNSQNTDLILIGRTVQCNVANTVCIRDQNTEVYARQHARTQRYKCIHTSTNTLKLCARVGIRNTFERVTKLRAYL